MKIVTVVGARPQFIKAAAVSRPLREKNEEVLIHTGQHYDPNMSAIFFEELNIPKPDYNLGVGSGSHAKQTADMLVGIEKILTKEKPDFCMVYGDTNSTFAGALAASKLLIPVVHVEAGLRSYNMKMPEEQNRVLTDHISSILCCPTYNAVNNLEKEGITNNVYMNGDVMCDAVLFYSQKMRKMSDVYFWNRLKSLFGDISPINEWYLATIHRAENTDSILKLEQILNAFEKLEKNVIFPVHPRIRRFVNELVTTHEYRNTLFVEPMGYLDMLFFTQNAIKVITDSGGLQKEAYILGTDCVTVRDQTEWIETLNGNHNVLARPVETDILSKIRETVIKNEIHPDVFGKGDATQKIVDMLSRQERRLQTR